MTLRLDEAWREISALHPVQAGPILGHSIDTAFVPRRGYGADSVRAARQLLGELPLNPGGVVTGESITYVVLSSGTVIAWLTYHARVVTPAAVLTGDQLEHQRHAVAALSQLTRSALYALSLLRNHREQRSSGPEPDIRNPGTAVLASNPADPTATFWANLTPDLEQTRAHLAGITGTEPGTDALVVVAIGYGGFGRGSQPLTLPVLCAIKSLAVSSTIPAWAIGDWLADAGDPVDTSDPDAIVAAFEAAYLGHFPFQRAYAEAERDRRGWTAALADAGIPVRFLDLDRLASELFANEVRAIRLNDGSLVVFRR